MDFYLNTENTYERLKQEYYKYGKLVVAVDFDDTIYDFHNKGRKYNCVISLLKKIKPYAYIVIFSASSKERYGEIKEYCSRIGLTIDSINENIAGLNLPKGKKIYYNILLDDRAGLKESYDILNKLYRKIHSNSLEGKLEDLEELFISIGYAKCTIEEIKKRNNARTIEEYINNLKGEKESWIKNN